MFQNPHFSGQLASDRHREALARAGQSRLARQARAGQAEQAPAARVAPRPRRWVLGATAWLRLVPRP